MVFFHHVNLFAAEGWQRPFYLFTRELYTGVSLFFVLSGFLIYIRYKESFQQNKKWLGDYIQNRFARIYPLYFLLTIVTFFVLFRNDSFSFGQQGIFVLFTNLTLIKGFFSELKFTGIAQGWSLTIEECFYVLMPFFFWWSRRFIIYLLPFIFLGTGFLLVGIFGNSNVYGFFSDNKFMLLYTFFGRCFEFFVGILLARNLFDLQKKSTGSTVTYVSVFMLIALLTSLSFVATDKEIGVEHPAGFFIHHFILPLSIAGLMFGLITEKTFLQKILASKLFDILGKSSYAFYLVHAGVFYLFIYYKITDNGILIFVLINLLSVFLYYFIEKPLNKKLRASDSATNKKATP